MVHSERTLQLARVGAHFVEQRLAIGQRRREEKRLPRRRRRLQRAEDLENVGLRRRARQACERGAMRAASS